MPPSRAATALCLAGAVAIVFDLRSDEILHTAMLLAGTVGLWLVTRSPWAFVGLAAIALGQLVALTPDMAPRSILDPREFESDPSLTIRAIGAWLTLAGLGAASIATRRATGTLYTVLILAFVALSLFMRPVVALAMPEAPWELEEPRGLWLIVQLLDRLLFFRGDATMLMAGAFVVTGLAPQGVAPIGRIAPAILGVLGAICADAWVRGPIDVPDQAHQIAPLVPAAFHVLGWLLLGVSLALHARERKSVAGWIAAAVCALQALCCCTVVPFDWGTQIAPHIPRVPLVVGLAGLAIAAFGIRELPHRAARIVAGVLASAGALGALLTGLGIALMAADIADFETPEWGLERFTAPCGHWALGIWLVLHALRPALGPAPDAPASAAAAPSPVPTPT